MAYHLEPGYMHSTVIELLKARVREGVSIKSMADELSSQGIEYQWLFKLIKGDIKAPDVNKVEVLYRFLTGKSVECLDAAA